MTESSADYMNQLSFWSQENDHITNKTERTTVLNNLESVTSSGNFAGGVAGELETVNLAGVLDGTLSAGSFHSFTVSKVSVTGVDNGYEVKATGTAQDFDGDYAGGGFGRAYGGTIDDVTLQKLRSVEAANNKAAGFIASAGPGDVLGSGGLTINLLGLNYLLNIKNLLSIGQNIHVKITDSSVTGIDNGFTVSANEVRSGDLNSGSAGGFCGYMSGAQVSHCDVYQLKHTEVTPPSDLEAVSAPSYFDGAQSTYAVTGGHHSGGYVGNADIGSAASVGGGLGALGSALSLQNVLTALSVVVTTIEHSDVQGAAGGFSAIADGSSGTVDKAGGYAGAVNGAHIQNSHCKNFYYIIGQESAGGYVGTMKPGNVAALLDNTSILSALVNASNMLTLIETFIPTMRNSTTSCVPCGGAVRAQAASDSSNQRGCAGGYCGYNEGSSVKGISIGYDVYGGGAGNDHDGSGVNGKTGGFVGFNNEGHLLDNKMEYCDVVRGTADYVGPFSGYTSLQSVYSFNTLKSIEGDNNTYPVYRQTDLTYVLTKDKQVIDDQPVADSGFKRFDITHLAAPLVPGENEPYHKTFEKWYNAVLASDAQSSDQKRIKVYMSN